MTEPKLSELPNDWVWTKLEEISEKIEKVNPRNHEKEELIYIDIASIDNTNQKIINPKIYLGKDAPSRARQLIKAGDILFSTVRTYLKNIAIVGKEYDGQIASTGFCVIRPNKSINNKFIFYFSQTDLFINSLNQIQRGTSYPAVRDSDVFSQPFPLAPLPEQCRIVVRIEELFSHLTAGVEALQRAKVQLQRYRQAVLKAAVEGRLTEEWRRTHPEVEPAENLLKRISIEKHSKIKIEEKIESIKEILSELPRTWAWTNLENLKDFSLYGPRFSSDDYSTEGYAVLRTSDISDSGKVNTKTAPLIPLDRDDFLKSLTSRI
jgi:type I restriction enzyme S subunit